MIEVFKLDPEAKTPTRNNPNDAGIDLYALEDVTIFTGCTAKVKTGIAIHIPIGYVGKIEDRSGLAAKGLRTGGGVVDSGYSGDVTIVIHNFSAVSDLCNKTDTKMDTAYLIRKHDKIAQLLIYKVETQPVIEVKQLWTSDRSDNGIGSSGK